MFTALVLARQLILPSYFLVLLPADELEALMPCLSDHQADEGIAELMGVALRPPGRGGDGKGSGKEANGRDGYFEILWGAELTKRLRDGSDHDASKGSGGGRFGSNL
jgi:hypothetical protein